MIRQFLTISLLLIITISKENINFKAESEDLKILVKQFENNVYSFNIPEDWSLTDSEKIDDGIYYISVEKNGIDSSGLMTIVSFEFLVDLDELINVNIEELQNNSTLNEFNFDSIHDSKFNNISARSTRYNFKTMGINHVGLVYALSSKNNTVVILLQEALEDKKENSNGFDSMEGSFKIK
jgi:hypothetical protein